MNASLTNTPLRVLHIASGDLWAGAEVQIFTLLSQLHGHEHVEVHAALLNEGELARRLRNQGIPVTVYDETRLSGVTIFQRLRRLMRNIRPDVIHTHRQKENVLGAFACLLSVRVPCVRTSHGAPEHMHRGWGSLHKRLFAATDVFCGKHLQQRIVAVSSDLAAILRRTFESEKIVVIENGVDTAALESIAPSADFRIADPGATHIGIVGRLVPVKRVDIFLDTAATLLAQAPERKWRFHVIGDGSLRAQLQHRAAQLGISANVVFHGHRSDSAVCLASLDALVMCSDHEGMPMTPLEAIATGTPIVAHDIGGLADILNGGAGGVLVDNHSSQGYAKALLQLLASDQATLVALGRCRVQNRFSAQHNAEQILQMYRRLIGENA